MTEIAQLHTPAKNRAHKARPWYVKYFFELFRNAPYGSLTVTTPRGRVHRFEGNEPGVEAEFIVNDWSVVKIALLRGDIGFGEAYIDGLWDSPDIGTLMTYMVQNMDALERVCHGNWFMRQAFNLMNFFRRNSKMGSQRNIRAHYDVGNDFYRLWLDETMTYSAAFFDGDEARDLASAQRAKYQRLLSKIDKVEASILEIGCGWGGFAEEATKAGHAIKGLTLSREQLAFAQQRLSHSAAQANVSLELQDYRDEAGVFDYIVSIEMFEAVGERYWPTYFNAIKQRLKEGGKALIQTITIDHAHFEDYRNRSDFIRHYTFPGGMLPSIPRIEEELAKAGLACREAMAFGQDYARTLREWLARLDARREEILALGYSEEFLRSWRFYIGCCIGAFTAGRTDVVQLEIVHA